MFKTYLKAWVISWFAGWTALTALFVVVVCFGKHNPEGYGSIEAFIVFAGVSLIGAIASIGGALESIRRLGAARVLRVWLDRNCRSITLTVEQLAKARWMKVYWLKGGRNLSEYLFDPDFLLEGDCESLVVFVDSVPLREKKPEAFIVEIETDEEIFLGSSNFFFEGWRLSLLDGRTATTCFLSDGFMSKKVESSSCHSNLTYAKALMIMRNFQNWAHYERSLTLVDIVNELDSTRGDRATRSPKIRDLKEAIKEHLLVGDGFENEKFRKILRNIQGKSEEVEENTDNKKVESAV